MKKKKTHTHTHTHTISFPHENSTYNDAIYYMMEEEEGYKYNTRSIRQWKYYIGCLLCVHIQRNEILIGREEREWQIFISCYDYTICTRYKLQNASIVQLLRWGDAWMFMWKKMYIYQYHLVGGTCSCNCQVKYYSSTKCQNIMISPEQTMDITLCCIQQLPISSIHAIHQLLSQRCPSMYLHMRTFDVRYSSLWIVVIILWGKIVIVGEQCEDNVRTTHFCCFLATS